MIPTIDNKLKLQNYCFLSRHLVNTCIWWWIQLPLLFWLIKGEILPTTLKWDSLFEKEVFKRRPTFELFFVVFWKNRKSICLNLAVGVKKIPNLSMKNYTQFHSFSLIKRVKYEMISPFSRNEKWKIFSLHSFREVKVKIKWLKIEIEKWIFKKILENSRESRLSLVTG